MRALVAIAIVSAMGMAGFSAATQTAAAIFSNQPALGQPLYRDRQMALYPPWAILEWKARWGSRFPKPFAFALFVGVMFGGAGALIAAVVAQGAIPRLRRHSGSGWANFSEARAAGLFDTGGVILGKFDGEILAYNGPGHTLLIGASRSGKGRGHVVPTLLSWPQSALVLDIKGELADGDPRHAFPGTGGFRETLGPVLRFAPTRAASARFNPLFEVRKGSDEVRDVQNIVEIVVDPAGDGRNVDFWDRSAKQVLVGLILHILYVEPDHRKTLGVVREKLRDLDTHAQHMRLVLHRRSPETGQPEVHPEVLHAAESYLSGEERVRSGIKATAESFFGAFADPLIAANTSSSDFRVGDLMCHERPLTLFLQPPPSDAMRLMPLMRLIINQISRALMEEQTKDAAGRQKRHDLLMLLDEFPQIGKLPFFETAMGAFAGYGLRAYLVCQSLNHIVRAYGRDNVIVDNCHVVTTFAAADMETAKSLAAMAGERWEIVEQESVTRPRPVLSTRRGSTTFREERRPLLLPGDLRQLAPDEEIVFVAGAKPVRARKLQFDREAVFRERLMCTQARPAKLSTGHDWVGVRALGQLVKGEKGAVRVAPALKKARTQHDQGELFEGMSNSEKALAGFKRSNAEAPASTGI